MAVTRQEYQAAYRAAHKEGIARYKQMWKEQHPDRVAAGEARRRRTEKNRAYRAAYYERNRAAIAAYRRAAYQRLRHDPTYRMLRKEQKRRGRLRYYGLTEAQHAALLEAQDGKCAICRRAETYRRNGRVVQLAIDHNHETGVVRGLLCRSCNQALGALEAHIEQAATYLARRT